MGVSGTGPLVGAGPTLGGFANPYGLGMGY